MVSPIYIIAAALAAGFLMPLAGQVKGRFGSIVSPAIFYAAVLALIAIPASWISALASGDSAAVVYTAGARPPLSIALRMGLTEALVLTAINLTGLFGALSASRALGQRRTGYVLVMMMLLGANGLVLTRDLFNVFVFMEILAIGTYGLIALNDRPAQYAAGFKYLIAGGISSVLFLLGTVYLYRVTGTLDIDMMVAAAGDGAALAAGVGFTAVFLVFAGMLIELKPFPANGWALDLYQAADPGVASLVSAGGATALVITLMKIAPLFPASLLQALLWVGVITFAAANLIGLKQTDAQRMLGYSSVAQIGLVVAALALSQIYGFSTTYVMIVVGGLLVNHLLAKAGLFWIAGAASREATSGLDAPGAAQDTTPASTPHGELGRGAVRGGRADGRIKTVAPIVGIGAVILGLALAGLPPFPGFFAKWQLVNTLIAGNNIAILVLIALGSLFEAIYLFRWVGGLIARRTGGEPDAADGGMSDRATTEDPDAAPVPVAARARISLPTGPAIGVIVMAILVTGIGIFVGWTLGLNDRTVALPIALAVVMLLLEWLPSRVKGVLALAAISGYAWLIYPMATGIALVFGAIFAVGGVAVVVATLARRAKTGTYTLFTLAATSLIGLVIASEPLSFFVLWELMTIGTWLLLARSSRNGAPGEGPGPQKAATRYIGFAIASALLIMIGLVFAQQESIVAAGGAIDASGNVVLPQLYGADGFTRMPSLGGLWPTGSGWPGLSSARAAGSATGTGGLTDVVDSFRSRLLAYTYRGAGVGMGEWSVGIPAGARSVVFILLALGFLIKVGAIGLHVWLPDSYAETDNDLTTFFSQSVSKAGVLGIIMLLIMVGTPAIGGAGAAARGGLGAINWNVLLGWIGALTALFGALLAVFREDVKQLLAYSSLSQVGYMILGISMATHLGWVAGIYLAVIHFLFKGMLFLAMTGVILRTGTRNMYEMGGLIKRMPVTYLSVLMAIIALSGVPPLAGFGGKWLIYGALIENGWYLQTGVAFFASTIAFLYLFRMIYTVFLGQLKDNLREVREAPLPLLIPQVIFMMLLMLVSMFPSLVLRPIMAGVSTFLGTTTAWDGQAVITALGYWNGSWVMYVTMGVFILPLGWLMVMSGRRPQKVKQFNMVFASERPARPETTHFAHNFYAPYRKALGFLAAPLVQRTWSGITDGVAAIAGAIRQIYTGNGQTYALHILLFTVVLYLVTGGAPWN